MVLSSFIKNPTRTTYGGKDEDERIKFILRGSGINTVPWLFFTTIMVLTPNIILPLLRNVKILGQSLPLENAIIVTLFWYLIAFGYFFQNFLNWFFNVLIITNKKIIDIDFYGVTYKNISETTLTHVEDVTSTIEGPIGLIFNVGNIFIQTAGEQREFEFNNVKDPSYVRDLIADLVASVRNHRKDNGKNDGR